MKLFYLVQADLLDTVLGAVVTQAVAGFTEKAGAHLTAGGGEQVILLGSNAGELKQALAFKGLHGKGRLENDVGNEVKAGIEIVAQDLGVDPKPVVAAITFDAATEAFYFGGDLFGGAGRCS